MKPGGRWLRFRATQESAVEEVAFSWRARFSLVPLVWLDVVDSFEAGTGALAARLWGAVRVMRGEGPEIDRGEAMRYLAELPWVPHAFWANDALAWRVAGDDAVDVRTGVGGAEVAVRLHFDVAGDVVASSARRPRETGGETRETPWGGRFGEYAVVGGVRLPTRAEVSWELPEGRFTYFRGVVTGLEALFS